MPKKGSFAQGNHDVRVIWVLFFCRSPLMLCWPVPVPGRLLHWTTLCTKKLKPQCANANAHNQFCWPRVITRSRGNCGFVVLTRDIGICSIQRGVLPQNDRISWFRGSRGF